ncbi:MAG: hypothetical protein PHE78_06675 [Candidatus Gastranaerophilales bacterium]|nr:hypothetical protein [Candidatus Gastranaerophilales bacterium]
MLSKLLRGLYKRSNSNNGPLIVLGAFGWFVSMLAQLAGIKSNKKLTPDKKKFLYEQEKNEGICNIGLYLLFTSTLSGVADALHRKGKILTKATKPIIEKFAKENNFDSIDDVYAKAKSLGKNVVAYMKEIKPGIELEPFAKKSGVATAATILASILSCNIVTPILKNKMAYNALKKQEKLMPKETFPSNTKLFANPQVFQNSKVFSGIMKI